MAQKKKFEDVGGVLTLRQALYHAVHDFPGGCPVVAAYFGAKPDTLQKKVSLTNDAHHPTLQDFEEILAVTKDPRIFSALGEPNGVVWSLLSDMPEAPADMDVLSSGNRLIQSSAGALQQLVTSLEDSVVTGEELEVLRARVYEVQQHLQALNVIAEKFKELS